MITDEHISNIKILYVEDDEIMRTVLTDFLRRRCDNVIVARDGEEGLQLFKSLSPDIVITDICMPKMSGLDMAEQIRAITPNIPIIITTGYNDESYYQRAIDLDIDRYIKKPFPLKEFMRILSIAVKTVIQEKEINNQSILIKHILDLSENFMIITDGETISYANSALLRFAGVKTLDEFNTGYHGMDKIIYRKDDDVFYKDKTFYEWVHTVKDESAKGNTGLIIYAKKPNDSSGEVFSYLINVNQFPNNKDLLLSFSDITNIEKEAVYYKEIAQYDELTGIYNRKKFNEELEKSVNIAQRYQHGLSILFFDLDHFKNINDQYGHLTGDYVLQEIVKVVEGSIRKTDILARYGGEEFILVMPHTDLKDALDTAERIRLAIETHKFRSITQLTCSFGVTEYMLTDTPEQFVDRADKALYIAKNNGRNRVEYI